MDERDQLIVDMYKKYAKKDISQSDVSRVKEMYGDDVDAMINDIYTKYNKKSLTTESLGKIKGLYNLTPTQQATQEVEQPIETPQQEVGESPQVPQDTVRTGQFGNVGLDIPKQTVDESEYQKELERNPLVTFGKKMYETIQMMGAGFSAKGAGSISSITSANQAKLESLKGISDDEIIEMPNISDPRRGKTQYKAGDYKRMMADRIVGGNKAAEASLEYAIKANLDLADSDVISSLSQIKDGWDLVNFISSSMGQAVAQIPLAISTAGAASYAMESGNIYLDVIQEVAERDGITPIQVIQQGKDEKALAEIGGALSGALELVGAKKVMDAFGIDNIKKDLRKRALKIFVNSQIEGATEVGQETVGSAIKGIAVDGMPRIPGISQALDAYAMGMFGSAGLQAPSLLRGSKKTTTEQDTADDQEAEVVEDPIDIDVQPVILDVDGVEYGFIRDSNDNMELTRDELSELEAMSIKDKLSNKYPKMSFEIQDNTDPNDPLASPNFTVVGKPKSTPKYTQGEKSVDKKTVEGTIEKAETIEELEGLGIENDSELESKRSDKFKEISDKSKSVIDEIVDANEQLDTQESDESIQKQDIVEEPTGEEPMVVDDVQQEPDDKGADTEVSVEQQKKEDLKGVEGKKQVGLSSEGGKFSIATLTQGKGGFNQEVELTKNEKKELRSLDAEQELDGNSKSLVERRALLTQKIIDRNKIEGVTALTPNIINDKYEGKLEEVQQESTDKGTDTEVSVEDKGTEVKDEYFGIDEKGNINPFIFKPSNYTSDALSSSGLKVGPGGIDEAKKSIDRTKRINKTLNDPEIEATIDVISQAIELYNLSQDLTPKNKIKRKEKADALIDNISKSKDISSIIENSNDFFKLMSDNFSAETKEFSFEIKSLNAIKKAINQMADKVQEKYGSLSNIKDVKPIESKLIEQNEKTEVKTDSKELLEGVRKEGDKDQGRKEGEQLREEEALKDVESTAKALDELPTDAKMEEYVQVTELAETPIMDNELLISEAYHKAKADGSNPELVKAVESLLTKQDAKPTSKETPIADVSGDTAVEGKEFSIDGKKRFFHASGEKRKGRLIPNTAKQFGTGVYFSTSKEKVSFEFGEEVTEVSLKIENPVYTDSREWNKVEDLAIQKANEGKPVDEDGDIIGEEYDIDEIDAKFISDAAKELGYDAIIDKGSPMYENEINVLDESKIEYQEDVEIKKQEAPIKSKTVGTEEVGKEPLTVQEKQVSKELKITEDEARKSKSATPKRTRKSKNIANAIQDEAKIVEDSGDATRAAELITTIEVAEDAILNNAEVDESFGKKHGISEVDFANEWNSLGKQAELYRVYETLVGEPLDTDGNSSFPSDKAKEFAQDLLESLSKEGIKLKQPLEVDGLQIKVIPQKTKPATKKGIDALQSVVSKDNLRPNMQGVFFDEGNMVATNGHVLTVQKKLDSDKDIIKKAKEASVKTLEKTLGKKQAVEKTNENYNKIEKEGLEGQIINMKTGQIVDERYPNYKGVIPIENAIISESLNIQDQIDLASGADLALSNNNKDIKPLVFKITESIEIGLNTSLYKDILQSLQGSGVKNITLEFDSPSRAVVIKGDNGNIGIIMPVILAEDVKNRSQSIPIKTTNKTKKKAPTEKSEVTVNDTRQRVTFEVFGEQMTGSRDGDAIIGDDGVRYQESMVQDLKEIPEKDRLTKQKESVKKAFDEVKKTFNEGNKQGIIFDFEKAAKDDIRFYNALRNLVVEYARLKGMQFDQAIEELGKVFKKPLSKKNKDYVRTIWDEVTVKKPTVKQSIKEATEGKPSTEKTLLVNEYQELKRSLREQIKAAKEGYKQGKKEATDKAKEKADRITTIRNVITKFVKDDLTDIKLDKLTRGEVNKIISALNTVKTETSLNRAVDKIFDLIAKSANNARVSKAKTKQKAARANVKKGKIGLTEHNGAIDTLLKIDPNIVPREVFERFEAIIDSLSKRRSVLSPIEKNRLIDESNDILKKVEEENSKIAELKQAYEQAEKVKGVKTIDGKKVKYDSYSKTVDKMLKDGIINEDDARLMRDRRNDIVEKESEVSEEVDVEAAKQELITEILDQDNSLPERNPLFNSDETKILNFFNSLTKEDLENLSLTDLKRINGLKENLRNNYVPHLAEKYRSKIEGVRAAKPLISILGNFKGKATNLWNFISATKAGIKNRRRRGFTSTMQEKIRRNPTLYIDQVIGNFKNTTLYDNTFRKLSEGHSGYSFLVEKLQTKLSIADRKLKKPFESRTKISLIRLQEQFDSNDGQNSAKEWLEATISDRNSIYDSEAKAELQKIFDKYTDSEGEFDVKKAKQSFSQEESNAYKALKEHFEALRDKADFTATTIRGNRVPMYDNYHPVYKAVLGFEDSMELDKLKAMSKPSTKAGTLTDRTGTVHAVSFDPFEVAMLNAKDVLLDYYMTPVMNEVNSTMDALQKAAENEQEANAVTALRRVINEVTENVIGVNFGSSNIADAIINELTRKGYQATLSGVGRSAAELTSNTVFAAVYKPTEFTNGASILMNYKGDIATLASVVENVPSTQKIRLFNYGGMSSKHIDYSRSGNEMRKVLSPDSKTREILNKAGNYYRAVDRWASNIVSTPDQLIARPLWFGGFDQEFTNITGKKPDFKKIAEKDENYIQDNRNAIDQATKYADSVVTEAVSSQNPFDSVPKNQIRPSKSWITNFYRSFNSFMSNFRIFEHNSAVRGISSLVTNGVLTKEQGGKLLAAVAARVATYSLITTTLVPMSFKAIVSLFGYEPEDEEEKNTVGNILAKEAFSTVAMLAINRNIGNFGNIPLNFGVEYLNKKYGEGVTYKDEYEAYGDNVVFPLVPLERQGYGKDIGTSAALNMLGPYSPMGKTLHNGATYFQRMMDAKTEETRDKNRDKLFYKTSFEIAGNLGLIPNYRDFRGVVNTILYETKQKAIEASKNEDVEELDFDFDMPSFEEENINFDEIEFDN